MSTCRTVALVGAVALVVAMIAFTPVRSVAATTCADGDSGDAGSGSLDVTVSHRCARTPPSSGHAPPEPETKTVDCGPRQIDPPPALPGPSCTQIAEDCALAAGEAAAPNTTTVMFLTKQTNGTWYIDSYDCTYATTARPAVPATDARAEVIRLLPRPAIGTGPPGGVTLVNIQTLFWLDTAATRNLGTVTLLGHAVTIKTTVDHVSWRFGDGSTATITGPGKPYTSANPCTTKLCPDYDGHIYRRDGTMTVTATATWTARYRVDNGPWQSLPAPINGTPSAITLTVKQARAILVPGPDD